MGGLGPRTWIDAPLNGSNLPLESVVVRSHVTSEGGTHSAVLYVNGSQVRVDNVVDASAQLVEISQVWVPAAAGDYEIYVVAIDAAGNEGRSRPVHVHIGGQVVNPPPVQNILQQSGITSTPAQACQVPTFTFSTNANCREGPGTDYDVNASFLQGQSAQIDGRNQTDPRWWWVLSSGGAHCWVADTTGSSSCLIADVPIITAPPPPVVIIPTDTSLPPPPASQPTTPSNFGVANKTCDSSSYVVSLSWSDSTGEDGYRVYRDGQVIATLPANATLYDDVSPNYNAHNYFVQAYNNSGTANGPIMSSSGCLF